VTSKRESTLGQELHQASLSGNPADEHRGLFGLRMATTLGEIICSESNLPKLISDSTEFGEKAELLLKGAAGSSLRKCYEIQLDTNVCKTWPDLQRLPALPDFPGDSISIKASLEFGRVVLSSLLR